MLGIWYLNYIKEFPVRSHLYIEISILPNIGKVLNFKHFYLRIIIKADFGKNFKIYKKHINASYVRILGQLNHFLPFYAILVHFWPIFPYKEKWAKMSKMA